MDQENNNIITETENDEIIEKEEETVAAEEELAEYFGENAEDMSEGGGKKKKKWPIVLAVIFGVIAILIAAVCVWLFVDFNKNPEDVNLSYIDNQGNICPAETREGGETIVIVSDENGDLWEVAVNDDGSLGTTGDKANDRYDISDITEKYTGPDIDESANANDFTGDVVENDSTAGQPEEPSASQTEPTSVTETTAQPTTASTTQPTTESSTATPNILRYQQMFSSGIYYMEFTTNDKELGDSPIIAAAKNGNILIKAQMEGLDCSMLYLKNKDKTYILIHNFKKYCSVPESMLGDDFNMNSFNLMESFASDIDPASITTDTVTINGQTLTRESYTTADGSVMSYYFDGETLVRLDNNSEGESVETYISKITNDVPDSTFEIPSNYGYLNLSWLDFLS